MNNKIQKLQDEIELVEELNKSIKAPWETKDVRAKQLRMELKALDAKYGIYDKTKERLRGSGGWSKSSSISNSPKNKGHVTFLQPGSNE